MVLVWDPWIVEVDLGCIHDTVLCRAEVNCGPLWGMMV